MIKKLLKAYGTISVLSEYSAFIVGSSNYAETVGIIERSLIGQEETASSQLNITLLIESTPSEMNIRRQLVFENVLKNFFQRNFALPSMTVNKCYVDMLSQDWDTNIFDLDDRTALLVKIQMDILLQIKINNNDDELLLTHPLEEYTSNFFDSRGMHFARELSETDDIFFQNVRSISTPTSTYKSYSVVKNVGNEEAADHQESKSHSVAGWIVAFGSISAVFSSVIILYSRRLPDNDNKKDNDSLGESISSFDEDISDASIKTKSAMNDEAVQVDSLSRISEITVNRELSRNPSERELIMHKYVLDTIPEIYSETSSISDAMSDFLTPVCKMYSDLEC